MVKTQVLAASLILIGTIFAILEMQLYGKVDESGMLQESLFLPLAWFCALGALLILVFRFRKSR